jgi:hypothetical protein
VGKPYQAAPGRRLEGSAAAAEAGRQRQVASSSTSPAAAGGRQQQEVASSRRSPAAGGRQQQEVGSSRSLAAAAVLLTIDIDVTMCQSVETTNWQVDLLLESSLVLFAHRPREPAWRRFSTAFHWSSGFICSFLSFVFSNTPLATA